MLKVVIILGTGIITFFIISRIVDNILMKAYWKRLFELNHNEFETEHHEKLTRQAHFIINTVRPMAFAFIIFGLGSLVIAWLQLLFWGTVCSFIYFSGLTMIACLAGRKLSFGQAAGSMMIIIILVLACFLTFR